MAYPYYPQNYGNYPQTYPQAMAQPTTDMNWVQGESGAKGYHVSPNSTVTLWDSEAQTIYIKSANAVGIPTITVLDYEIRKPEGNLVTPQANDQINSEIDQIKKEINYLKSQLKGKGKKDE